MPIIAQNGIFVKMERGGQDKKNHRNLAIR